MAEVDPNERIVGGTIHKVVFSTQQLSARLDDRARFSRWREQWNALYGSAELERVGDRPFAAKFQFVPVGAVGIGQFAGAMKTTSRNARHVAADKADNFCLVLHDGRSGVMTSQHGREGILDRNIAVLLTNAEPGSVRGSPEIGWYAVNVARGQLLELVANVDNLVGAPLAPGGEALRHLRRYAGLVLGQPAINNDPALIDRVSITLLDLMALVLGAGRDTAQVACTRGLRSARLNEVLAKIKAAFANPAFSSNEVARSLGLSRRYVNDLLFETGVSFANRVLELRLQKARAMLADTRHDRLKVSEIAYASGFNEVSYFNRCFRRRFGASPTQYRGNSNET